MSKLNMSLLQEVKQAFVPQPGGQTEPVAGAGPMTAAEGSPVGGAPAGDPNAAPGGAPGAMPPAPPPGVDPAMAGMLGGGAAPAPGPQMQGTSMINISINDLIKLFKVFQQGSAPAAAPAAAPAPASSSDQKLDRFMQEYGPVLDALKAGG